MENLDALYIKWGSFKSIECLESCRGLKHLSIGNGTKIESIRPLSRISSLETLELENLKRIEDFGELKSLRSLEGLSIDGSMWTPQKIADLSFLENLSELRFFTMRNTKLGVRSFDPLVKLGKLVRFNSSWNYSEDEFAKLKKLPNLKLGNVQTSWKREKRRMGL